MKYICVLISGKAGVGKSIFASMLKTELNDSMSVANIIPFANKLKFIAELMGWDKEKDTRGRMLLQNLGRIGREYDINLWVKHALAQFTSRLVFIADDWRFPSELQYIRSMPEKYVTYTIRITAPSREVLKNTQAYFDISEVSLDTFTDDMFDYVIDNDNSTLDLLREHAKTVAMHIKNLLLEIDIWKKSY